MIENDDLLDQEESLDEDMFLEDFDEKDMLFDDYPEEIAEAVEMVMEALEADEPIPNGIAKGIFEALVGRMIEHGMDGEEVYQRLANVRSALA